MVILDMNALNFDKIKLNAYGPYNHGVWENPKINKKVGDEEFLTGRSNYIFEKFSEFMSKFTKDQISKMSIIDIGGYDGWFTYKKIQIVVLILVPII